MRFLPKIEQISILGKKNAAGFFGTLGAFVLKTLATLT